MPLTAIFDIDGTLVDTNYQHALAWYRAFRQHGVVLPVWQIHRAIGNGSDRVVEMLAANRSSNSSARRYAPSKARSIRR